MKYYFAPNRIIKAKKSFGSNKIAEIRNHKPVGISYTLGKQIKGSIWDVSSLSHKTCIANVDKNEKSEWAFPMNTSLNSLILGKEQEKPHIQIYQTYIKDYPGKT